MTSMPTSLGMLALKQASALTLLLSSCCALAVAQQLLDPNQPLSQYVHQSWQTAQGLPQNSVLAIARTPDGYLWLGTEEGLVRFDGLHFTLYDRTTTGMKNNLVTALLVDHTGDLWMGTFGGGVSKLHNNKFQSFDTRIGMPSDLVRALYEDAEGSMWIGTETGGLVRLKNGKLKVFSHKNGLADDTVFALAGDRQGRLWIGTHNGLSTFKNNAFSTVTTREGLSGDFIRALCSDGEDGMWVGTSDGLSRIFSSGIQRFSSKDGLPSNTVFSIRRDAVGSVWFGTSSGLGRLADGKFTTYSEKDGLTGKDVWAILDDSEGRLWIGTAGGGLNSLHSGAFGTVGRADGLVSDLVLPVFQDHDGGLWLGSDVGLTYRKDGRTITYTTKQGLPDNLIFSIAQDHNGTIWVGTRRGLATFGRGKFARVASVGQLSVLCTYVDHKGDLWIGTRNGLGHLSGGELRTYQIRDGLSNNNVMAIFEDARHILWIGTGGGGLNRFESGRFLSYTTKNGLGSDVVWAITGDSDETLWLGTSGGGLNRFRDGKFTVYGKSAGLYDDTVLAILDDRRGNLWLSSNRGVFRVSKSELSKFASGAIARFHSKSFGVADGMRDAECNGGFQPAGLRSADGKLMFPTVKGLAVVDPLSVREQKAPRSVLERVAVDGKELPLHTQVRVAPGKGQLEFQFTAPTSVSPEQIEFRYMLESFDKDWMNAGQRRTAYYTNISPGEYRFLVQAGRNGVWGETESALLTLEPHYYQTKSFGVMLLLLGTALCGAVFRIRVRSLKIREQRLIVLVDERTLALRESEAQLRRSRDELEQRVKERTSELLVMNRALEGEIAFRKETEEQLILAKETAEAASRAKSEFLANMSHEIRTPINGIIGMTDIALSTELKEDQQEYLEIVKFSADSLLAIVNDILDFSKIEANKLTLDSTTFELRESVGELIRSLSVRSRQKGLELNLDLGAEVPNSLVGDPLRLRQVLLNLLDNALKFTSKGSVSLSVGLESTSDESVHLHFAVRDTGIGISPEKQKTIFEAFSQADTSSTRRYGGTGLGLTISCQLVAMMGGRMWVDSQEGQGSTFHFTATIARQPARRRILVGLPDDPVAA